MSAFQSLQCIGDILILNIFTSLDWIGQDCCHGNTTEGKIWPHVYVWKWIRKIKISKSDINKMSNINSGFLCLKNDTRYYVTYNIILL